MLELVAESTNWGVGVGVGLAGIGAGLVTIGAANGMGRIAGAALEGIARQPDAAGKIQTPMIITAAMLEGVALFAAATCFLAQLSWLDKLKDMTN